MKNTIFLSDAHIPHEHPDALAFVCAVRDRYKTQRAISVGDELDYQSTSFHDHDPDARSPGDELSAAIKKLAYWHREFPKLRLARSNHGDMLARKIFSSGLPASILRDYADIYKTPGWTWHREIIEEMGPTNLIVRHSFDRNVKAALNRVGDACVVYGHHHTVFGVEYRRNLNFTQWAMCVGCIIDPASPAFSYDGQNLDRPVLGCGVVIDGQALPIPMWVKSNGRWNGRVS